MEDTISATLHYVVSKVVQNSFPAQYLYGKFAMNQERYLKIFSEFETMLRLGTEVSKLLAGTVPIETHFSYADTIYTKLLCHAISLHKLSPQIVNKPEHELWDLPSACAITRCIIEAHDVLGYMVFSEISPAEREFRLLLWQLHDQQRRLKMLQSIKSKNSEVEKICKRAIALSDEAISHPWFPNVGKEQQKKIKGGDAPPFLLSQRQRNEANSVNHEYHTSATMWLSQHVHTHPMAVHQLSEFQAGTPEALQISSMPIQYTLGFFATTITKMAKAFPKASIEVTGADDVLISNWCSVVQCGVSTA